MKQIRIRKVRVIQILSLLILAICVTAAVMVSGCSSSGHKNQNEKTVDVITELDTKITVTSENGISVKEKGDEPHDVWEKENGRWMFEQNDQGSFLVEGTFDDLTKIPPVSIYFPNKKTAKVSKFVLNTTQDYRGVNVYRLDTQGEEGFSSFTLEILNKAQFLKGGSDNPIFSIDSWNGSSTPSFPGLTRTQKGNGYKFLIRMSGSYY